MNSIHNLKMISCLKRDATYQGLKRISLWMYFIYQMDELF